MGARPSSYKGGGGFLNDVDGVIRDIQFTDEFNGKPFEPGKKPGTKEDKFHSLFAAVTVQVDGAEDTVTQHLFVGDYDQWEIGENGTSVVPHDEANQFGQSAPFSKFVASLVKAGFPEEDLPEDFEFEVLKGQRCRFGQEVVIDRKTNKPKVRVAKKGKFKGREFPDTTTIVTAYYGMEEDEAPVVKGKTTSKPASGSKPAAAVKGKTSKKAEQTPEDLAGTLVIQVLEEAKDSTIKKPKLRMLVLNKLGPGHPQKDAVLEAALDDDFLKTLEGITYSVKSTVLELVDKGEADDDATEEDDE